MREALFSSLCRAALIPIVEAPLLQRVRAIFQDFPGRHFRLKRSWKFVPFKAVKGMQSGQKSVIPFITVLTYDDPNGIALQLYNICVGHSSTPASKALLNPEIVRGTTDLKRGGGTSRLPHNCIGARTQFYDLPVSSPSSIVYTINITDFVHFWKCISSMIGRLLGPFAMNFVECNSGEPLAI